LQKDRSTANKSSSSSKGFFSSKAEPQSAALTGANRQKPNLPTQTYSNNCSLPDINKRTSMSEKSGGAINMVYAGSQTSTANQTGERGASFRRIGNQIS